MGSCAKRPAKGDRAVSEEPGAYRNAGYAAAESPLDSGEEAQLPVLGLGRLRLRPALLGQGRFDVGEIG